MGSKTSGRIADYQNTGYVDKCDEHPGLIDLEEVATSEWVLRNAGQLPATGTPVLVSPQLYGGRIAVVAASNRVVIGVLPSAFSYLYHCMVGGHSYEGRVVVSSMAAIKSVQVDLRRC